MNYDAVLLPEERTALRLRALYAAAGYTQFIMSKFEAYDLYAGNKDFLESERIITFTDVSGRLMALKPDVTLSIIKNTEPTAGEEKKLFYHEKVYRVPKGAPGFRELTQVGLEYMGETTPAGAAQVLELACRSLSEISEDYVLDLSHFGLITALLQNAGLAGEAAAGAVRCLNEKNAHVLKALCEQNGVPSAESEKLLMLLKVCGAPEQALPRLTAALGENEFLAELSALTAAVPADCRAHIRIDFSAPGNARYYNGAVFKGYVKGVPDYVLSGGQYDRLMRRMKKNCRALGFAVYLDSLQRLQTKGENGNGTA